MSRLHKHNDSSGTIFWGWFSPGDLCVRTSSVSYFPWPWNSFTESSWPSFLNAPVVKNVNGKLHLSQAHFYSPIPSQFTSGRKIIGGVAAAASFCRPASQPAATVLLLLSCLVPSQLAAFPLPFHLFFLPSFRKGRKEGRKLFHVTTRSFPLPLFCQGQKRKQIWDSSHPFWKEPATQCKNHEDTRDEMLRQEVQRQIL